MNWQDAERMANDVQKIAEDMAVGYADMGKEPPPPMRLIMMAQCAWTMMVFNPLVAELRQLQKKAPRTGLVNLNGKPI